MKIAAVIPARYASVRFAAKVLAKDTGKFLIQHTYEQVQRAKSPQMVLIAADDERILAAAESFGAKAVMTSPDCQSGTDRIAQAVKDIDVDIVINVQADEPEIDPAAIDTLADLISSDSDVPMATLACPFANAGQVNDPNLVKVIVDHRGRALYFSRSPIPYDRDKSGVGAFDQYLRHMGIYAYRKDTLLKLTALPQTPLELAEKLEQLRALENGIAIAVGIVGRFTDGIDTPQQYADFVKRYRENIATEK